MSTFTSVLAFPFHVLASVFRFIFQTLRIPFPRLPFSSLNFYRPLGGRAGPSDPYSVADRWVRSLEDETGAQCLSRAPANASGLDAGPSSLPGSGDLRSRYGAVGRRMLPDFVLGSYEEALRICQKEARIGCIILVSDEHDDVPDFKRHTLTDVNFVDLLHKNDFVVWGGDIRDREAWSAARKLQATTYPFVAFISLQPPRAPSSFTPNASRSTTPSLTVLSRHQGSSTPASGPTSTATLTDHITHQLLPRVSPFLGRIRAAARERELERALREEQDRAFRDSERRDREKVARRLEEEKRAEDEKRAEEQRLKAIEEARIMKEERKAKWRREARSALVGVEATGPHALRMGVRMPDGQRLVRMFERHDRVTALYCLVDTHLNPSESKEVVQEDAQSGEDALRDLMQQSGESTEEWWGFKLFLAYPRKEVAWTSGTTLSEVDGLEKGGQVLVEMISAGRKSEELPSGDGSDGYDTEESE
ncbi:hypothetical protein BV25DRAFT_1903364 [Artomyces pyxidatus]|uniref:Uncharacterized protein n=1 Tax=Artomyces pyxidatus TaxID=48021 RepID=A0ACB8SJ98_9AGAM|nr:hypothetical protein BV25DRAFT_1903364 [Artomyces pyxidatus]